MICSSSSRRLDTNDNLNKIGIKQTDSHTFGGESQYCRKPCVIFLETETYYGKCGKRFISRYLEMYPVESLNRNVKKNWEFLSNPARRDFVVNIPFQSIIWLVCEAMLASFVVSS